MTVSLQEQFGAEADLWSDWIPHSQGDPCPIPWAKKREWKVKVTSDAKLYGGGCDAADSGFWRHCLTTHYCYLLSAAPKQPMTATEVLARQQPWYPPQQEGFGPWVECNGLGYPSGIVGKDVAVMIRMERKRKEYSFAAYTYKNEDSWSELFVAYCVKIDPGTPTPAEIEATQQPQSPEQYVADIKKDEEAMARADSPLNDPMKGRDEIKTIPTPPAVKDEGWREYDPKYPPILPWTLEFKTLPGKTENDPSRHFYRVVDKPADECDGVACIVAPIGQRVGSGWWGC